MRHVLKLLLRILLHRDVMQSANVAGTGRDNGELHPQQTAIRMHESDFGFALFRIGVRIVQRGSKLGAVIGPHTIHQGASDDFVGGDAREACPCRIEESLEPPQQPRQGPLQNLSKNRFLLQGCHRRC